MTSRVEIQFRCFLRLLFATMKGARLRLEGDSCPVRDCGMGGLIRLDQSLEDQVHINLSLCTIIYTWSADLYWTRDEYLGGRWINHPAKFAACLACTPARPVETKMR